MNNYQIEVLDDSNPQKFVLIEVGLTLEEAWYWWKRIWDVGEMAVITHPDVEPF
jgi:hypothetical protein